jgi:hypothetical protein
MNFKIIFFSLVYSASCYCIADETRTLLLKNGDPYPSWYAQVLSGISAIANVEVVSEKNDAAQSTAESEGVKTVQSFDKLSVRVNSIIYMPAYFHLSDISLLNTFKKGTSLNLYEKNSKIKTYTWNGDKKRQPFFVMIEPCQEISQASLKVTHVFEEDELEMIRSLTSKLPKYEENEIGLFEIIKR